MNAPKPSSTRFGGTVSRARLRVEPSRRSRVEPASATMRLSMSTNAPESGRSDQRVSAVTWNSTITPLPRRAAVTSGVPSASVAQVRSVRPESGSASTCRVTVTSFGTAMPLNGLSRENAASCCGCSHESEPPSVRPPRRSFTGMRSSSAAARRGPAKRTSTPPSSTQLREPLARLARDVADVGEDQHRQVLRQELPHRLATASRARRAARRRTG